MHIVSCKLCFQMWMSVHWAVLIVMPMHNAATFPDLTLANAISRMATMATALNASPTVRTIHYHYHFI